MVPHTRAMVAAAAYALVTGKKVAGLHDHTAGTDLRIAAEARSPRIKAYDGDRAARFEGTLPDIYDEGTKAFVSFTVEGSTVRGYDRASASFYAAEVAEPFVQLYAYSDSAWFTYEVQLA